MNRTNIGLGLLKVLSSLPLGVLYLLADLIFFLAYYVVGYRKQVVHDNIKLSFPEYSNREVERIAKQFYQNLANIIVESLKALTISAKELERRVKWTDTSLWNELYSGETNVFALTLHQHNWEWILISATNQIPYEAIGIYKKLNNQFADKLMLQMRSRFGSRPVEMNDILREMARKTGRHKVFALVADQRPGPGAKQYWSNFLNQPTPFVMGPEQLAKFSKAPAVFIYMKKVKRGYYEVVNEMIAEPPYDRDSINILDNYIEKCEQVIREDPSGWLWSHKRFKFRKPQ